MKGVGMPLPPLVNYPEVGPGANVSAGSTARSSNPAAFTCGDAPRGGGHTAKAAMADWTWRFNRVTVQFSRLKKRGSELQRRDVRGAMFRQRERTKTVGHGPP